jgi:hypothetical protein
MEKIIVFVGTSVGGALGWWIGARVGMMTGFFLSVVGTGAGMYFARRWARSI